MPQSFLQVDGLFDPSARYAFTNISDEVFTSRWGGIPITVEPHQTIKIERHSPVENGGQAVAIKMTTELVDLIMTNVVRMDEMQMMADQKLTRNMARSDKAMSIGVPSARKEWEDKILKRLGADEEIGQGELSNMESMRESLKAEIVSQNTSKVSHEAPSIPMDAIGDLTGTGSIPPGGRNEVKPEPKPAKVKVIR